MAKVFLWTEDDLSPHHLASAFPHLLHDHHWLGQVGHHAARHLPQQRPLQGPALLVHQIGDIGLSEEAEAYGITDLFLGDELSAPKVVSFPPRHILRGPGISGSV